MRRLAICVALGLLSACSSPTDRAKKDLSFLEANGGTPRELCVAAGKVTDAARREADAVAYKYAKASQQARCTTVATFPQYADQPGGVPKVSDDVIADQLATLNRAAAR